jgi:hypothetical protein
MTRDEAIDKLKKLETDNYPDWVIDGLVALGLLHLETTEDKVRVAAAERLTGAFTQTSSMSAVQRQGKGEWSAITRDGALEILDVLTKSGFRITRD